METKQVTLQPGESQQVEFTYTPETVKFYSVKVNGLIGSFEAVGLPSTDIVVSPMECNNIIEGMTSNCRVHVANNGDAPALVTCEWYFGVSLVHTEQIEIGAGSEADFILALTNIPSGIYMVNAFFTWNGYSAEAHGTFSATAYVSPEPKISGYLNASFLIGAWDVYLRLVCHNYGGAECAELHADFYIDDVLVKSAASPGLPPGGEWERKVYLDAHDLGLERGEHLAHAVVRWDGHTTRMPVSGYEKFRVGIST